VMVGVSLLTVEGLRVAEEAVLAAFGVSRTCSVVELIGEASEHAEPWLVREAYWALVSRNRIAVTASGVAALVG
jgi:hypothetical protein